MGSVEKRRQQLPDGKLGQVTWRARYRDANGRQRSRSFTRRFDAERFLEANGTDLQRGEWVDPALRRTSFNDWAEAWWATTAKLRPNRDGAIGCSSKTMCCPTSVTHASEQSTTSTSRPLSPRNCGQGTGGSRSARW